RDDVLWRGFDALDEEDLREWLGRNGASDETLTRSPVLRGLYDLTFSYRNGDKRQPSLAAGKGLQSLLMMVNYEGSFMWRMRAGGARSRAAHCLRRREHIDPPRARCRLRRCRAGDPAWSPARNLRRARRGQPALSADARAWRDGANPRHAGVACEGRRGTPCA